MDFNTSSVNPMKSTRISNIEKEELLDFTSNEVGLGKFNLIMAFCILFLILSIFAPKIYLSNNIYYISREISRLHAVKELLAEEKLRLQGEIEKIHNKHLLLELEGQK